LVLTSGLATAVVATRLEARDVPLYGQCGGVSECRVLRTLLQSLILVFFFFRVAGRKAIPCPINALLTQCTYAEARQNVLRVFVPT
jgi:hypothetical protein